MSAGPDCCVLQLGEHHARLQDLRGVLLEELQKAQAEVHRAEEEVLGKEAEGIS